MKILVEYFKEKNVNTEKALEDFKGEFPVIYKESLLLAKKWVLGAIYDGFHKVAFRIHLIDLLICQK